MANALSKTEVWSGAFKNIYDLINNAKSSYPISIVSLGADFPDKPVDEVDDYPIVIISRVDSSGSDFVSFDVRQITLSTDVVVETTNAKNLDSLCNSVLNTLESSETTLKNNKIFNIHFTSADNDTFLRDGIKVYQRRLTFEFEFEYLVSG